jgi:hypothetical protein
MTIRAVGRAAYLIVQECRKQFRDRDIWAGTKKPDYGRVVDICTGTAQKELVGPGLLAIGTPIFVGFFLGPYALGGFLAGMILSGQLLAVFMANAGGAWDNAKKTIEDEPRGPLTGKGSEKHKASVTGDTVGDPLKDTAGPAINPLIKVMNMVSLLVLTLVLTYNIPTGLETFVLKKGADLTVTEGERTFKLVDNADPSGVLTNFTTGEPSDYALRDGALVKLSAATKGKAKGVTDTISGPVVADTRERPEGGAASGGVVQYVYLNVTDPDTEVVRQVRLRLDSTSSVSKPSNVWLTGWLVVIGSLIAIAWAWWQSKRETAEMRQMDDEFTQATEDRQPVGTH